MLQAHHNREQKFRYFMLVIYGAQDAQGLCVQSPRRKTPQHVLIHLFKREIYRIFIYEILHVLYVQINPMDLLLLKKNWKTQRVVYLC